MTASGGSANVKRGVWMGKVNRGKNAEEDGVKGQTRGKMDFRHPMQLQCPELRMESQYAQEAAQFTGTQYSRLDPG